MFSGNNQSHKFISSLDLNFLDIKFKSLKKDSIEISQSSKLGRNITLPLLNNKKNRIDTSFDGTSIISTPIHAHSIIPENVDLYDYIQSIEKVKKSQCTTVKKENQ